MERGKFLNDKVHGWGLKNIKVKNNYFYVK